jgi:hypothetical protein
MENLPRSLFGLPAHSLCSLPAGLAPLHKAQQQAESSKHAEARAPLLPLSLCSYARSRVSSRCQPSPTCQLCLLLPHAYSARTRSMEIATASDFFAIWRILSAPI